MPSGATLLIDRLSFIRSRQDAGRSVYERDARVQGCHEERRSFSEALCRRPRRGDRCPEEGGAEGMDCPDPRPEHPVSHLWRKHRHVHDFRVFDAPNLAQGRSFSPVRALLDMLDTVISTYTRGNARFGGRGRRCYVAIESHLPYSRSAPRTLRMLLQVVCCARLRLRSSTSSRGRRRRSRFSRCRPEERRS